MKFYRALLPYLIVLLMATALFADESEKMEESSKSNSGPAFVLMPWNIFVGGGNSFVVGADWVFASYNFIYVSPFEWNSLPEHSLIWTLRTQALWAGGFGFYLQPTVQYMLNKGPMFKVSIGPAFGYKQKIGFEYGGSIRLGGLLDLLNIEVGHLANSERTYFNIIFNLPTGLGIWV